MSVFFVQRETTDSGISAELDKIRRKFVAYNRIREYVFLHVIKQTVFIEVILQSIVKAGESRSRRCSNSSG